MNTTHDPVPPREASGSSIRNPTDPPPGAARVRLLDWLRSFLAANPFYLASLAALLYGIHRVSSDTGFLRLEVQQLFFNFTSLALTKRRWALPAEPELQASETGPNDGSGGV